MAARHRAASPGPQGSMTGRSRRRRRREAEPLMKGPDNLFLPPSFSLSLPLSLLPLPSPLTSPPLFPATPPNPLHSVPWSTFCKYLLNILVGGFSRSGGGGTCGVSAEGRYNAQKSCLKQKAEHLLKRLWGKYVWQLLFTVTVVTVSTPKSKPQHFSIWSETDGPRAIH